MNRMVILAVIGLAAWVWYLWAHRTDHPRANLAHADVVSTLDVGGRPVKRPTFHCDGRRYCSQMHSRAEAEYFVKHCPDTRMDGDHDGIPCENDSRW